MVGTVYCTLLALSSVFYQFFYPLFVLKIKQKPDTPYTNVGYGVGDQTDAKVLWLYYGTAAHQGTDLHLEKVDLYGAVAYS